jgi:hypothetical protein
MTGTILGTDGMGPANGWVLFAIAVGIPVLAGLIAEIAGRRQRSNR